MATIKHEKSLEIPKGGDFGKDFGNIFGKDDPKELAERQMFMIKEMNTNDMITSNKDMG